MRRLLTAAAMLAAAVAAASSPAFAERLPVPAVTIYPGDVISEDMLTERDYPEGTAARYPVVAFADAAVGLVARRTLPAGKAIPNNAVAEPDLVTRGSMIRAYYDVGMLTMEAMVLPLQNGALGDQVQARNPDSGKVIVGTVMADGSLRIGTP
jgi:flagella basal body P-ring formation protein FlgA